jgi:ABC-type polysaccharide/polyol phosphate transport system ATPase subunit
MPLPIMYDGWPGVARPDEGDLAIQLQDVGVRYRVPHEPLTSIKEYAIRRLQRRLLMHDFWALSDISLEVRHGEAFGIIGPNGAGKTTLLKVIARVLHPTAGRVVTRGVVAPLLELGAGFHPELTGRENLFLNGALLGFSRRQMAAKLEAIVDFADLWEFIDAPLRTYSSGMIARLGFSIATDVEPDILLVDEVLSVGDESFRRKSEARMQQFRDRGTTIVLVSHSPGVVTHLCQRALWLDHGLQLAAGEASAVVEAYASSLTTAERQP